MVSLKHANALVRSGNYRQAMELFAKLKSAQPNFPPYEHGYLHAMKRLCEAEGYDGKIPSDARVASHPESRKSTASRTFFVVTPVLNGEQFLRHSLDSVFGQAGDFHIDYIVKDAGSTDLTLSILIEYYERLNAGAIPLRCHGIRFRIESSPDKGLYDAVDHAFGLSKEKRRPSDVLTYINADDIYASNAFAAAAQVFENTAAQWVCGQINVINERGECLVAPEFPLSYARDDILEGLHDGRSLYVIQQEGNFWLSDVYAQARGMNRMLKLAGDFDLWRRLAGVCELLAVDRPLASFRSRAGQLSEQMDKYYAEIESVMKDVSPSKAAAPATPMQFYVGARQPLAGERQRPGPICFLNDDNSVREIAYIKRTWKTW